MSDAKLVAELRAAYEKAKQWAEAWCDEQASSLEDRAVAHAYKADLLIAALEAELADHALCRKWLQNMGDANSALLAAKEQLERERDEAWRLIELWQLASGLESGGDPGGVSPDMAQKHWSQVEREGDEARAAKAHVIQQAEIWAQEARTYRAACERIGWNISTHTEPPALAEARQQVERLCAELARLRPKALTDEECNRLDAVGLSGMGLSGTPTEATRGYIRAVLTAAGRYEAPKVSVSRANIQGAIFSKVRIEDRTSAVVNVLRDAGVEVVE
jgi:hypothetical protein